MERRKKEESGGRKNGRTKRGRDVSKEKCESEERTNK